MSKQLRPYQQQLLATVRARLKTGSHVLVQLPTGAGKSLCFATLIRETQARNPQFRCVVIVNRVTLAKQIESALLEEGVLDVGVCSGTLGRFEQHRRVVVGVFNTLARCSLPTYHLAILDECHRAGSLKYQTGYYSVAKDVQTLGFTATPYNQQGPIYGPKADSPFKTLDFQASLTELTTHGYLCRARLTGPHDLALTSTGAGLAIINGDYEQSALGQRVTQDGGKIKLQVADIIHRTVARKAVVISTVNIKHARLVYEALLEAGQAACIVTSDDDFDTREDEIADFRAGRSKYLVFVSIVAEGFDHPATDAVVLLRPTRSACMYVQTVGRGLRLAPGKKDCLVLDYANVIETNGPLDAPYILGNRKARKRDGLKLDHRITRCGACGEFYFPPQGTYPPCPNCQASNPPPKAPKLLVNGRPDQTASLYSEETAYIALPWSWFRVNRCTFDVGAQILTVIYHTDDVALRQYYQIPIPGRTMPKYAMGYWARIKSQFTQFFGCNAALTGAEIVRRCEEGRITMRPSMVMALPGLHHKHGEVRQLASPVEFDAAPEARQLTL